jgi:hypothetical protein
MLLCLHNLNVLFESGESKTVYLYCFVVWLTRAFLAFIQGASRQVLFLALIQVSSHLVWAMSILSVHNAEDMDSTIFYVLYGYQRTVHTVFINTTLIVLVFIFNF